MASVNKMCDGIIIIRHKVFRDDVIYNVLSKSHASIDINIHNSVDKQYQFHKQTILAYKFLTKNEKSKAMEILSKHYDYHKVCYNEGTKRFCDDCNEECLAFLY